MFIKGKQFSIAEMKPAPFIAKSLGIPGSIVNILGDKSVVVKTQDTAVIVSKLIDEKGNTVLPCDILKIGTRLKSAIS